MELRYRREVLVGLLLIVATVGFVLLMLWLKGKPFRSGRIVSAEFADVGGLKEGDQVHVAGVTVGSVQDIVLDPSLHVRVVMDLQQGPLPHADARFTVRALDLLGARYVDYAPGSAAAMLTPGTVVQGYEEPQLADMTTSLADQGRQVLANAADVLGPTTARELHETFAQAQRTLTALQRAGTQPSDTLIAALRELVRIGHRVDLLIERASNPTVETMQNLQQMSGNLAAITQTLNHTSATLDSVVARVNEGHGTVGQLLNDTTTLSEVRRTNQALYDLITDFREHPHKYVNVRVF